jgi:hypothetical protein
MQLQRDLGLRAPRTLSAKTPHRGVRRVAHVCFACRRSAKPPELPDQAPRTCPKCRGPLHCMGWSFHVPRRTDIDEWTKVEVLYSRGFRFFSSGFGQYPPLPKRLQDLKAFLKQHPNHPLRIAEPAPTRASDGPTAVSEEAAQQAAAADGAALDATCFASPSARRSPPGRLRSKGPQARSRTRPRS